MKMPKKSDIIICVAIFISALSLVTTYGLQIKLKNEIEARVDYTVTQTQTRELFMVSTTSEAETQESTSAVESSVESVSNVVHNNDTAKKEEKVSSQAAKPETAEKNQISENSVEEPKEKSTEIDSRLIINISSKKIHSSTCSHGLRTKEENKIIISSDDLQTYLNDGYTLCGVCHAYKE